MNSNIDNININRWSMTNSAVGWNWQEDKIFEKGLLDFPEGTEDRWRNIAYFLPGKSPEDVRMHYAALLHDVGEIESGRIDLSGYSEELMRWDESMETRVQSEISFGSGSKRSRHAEADRKKGTPWTEMEHRLFLTGLQKFGKGDWRSISRNIVVSRTPTQVASHAQKYFLRQSAVRKERKRSSIHDITTGMDNVPVPVPIPMPMPMPMPMPVHMPTNLHSQGDFQTFGFHMT